MGTAVPLPSNGSGTPERYRLVLPTDIALVGAAVDTVSACCFARTPASRRTRFRLATVVAEAIANAMIYGNGGDHSRHVAIEIELHGETIVLAITDEGDGFDPDAVASPAGEDSLEATRGRGLFMIRRLCDNVTFNDRGNTIWMTLPRR